MTITKLRDTVTGNVYVVWGTVQFGVGEVYASGGNTMSFASAAIKATRTPLKVDFDPSTGYVYDYVMGTNAFNGKLKVLTGAAAQAQLTELTAGAVPGAVSSDVINFKAEFAGTL